MLARWRWPIVCLFAAAVVAAQDQPDFSGQWFLVAATRPDPAVALRLTIRQPVTRTNQLGAPMAPAFMELIIERDFGSYVRTDSYRLGVQGGMVGGIVGGAAGGFSYQSRYSARWEGSRLVIETGSYSGPDQLAGPYWEHAEEWELDSRGMLILTIVDRASGVETKTDTFTYRRG